MKTNGVTAPFPDCFLNFVIARLTTKHLLLCSQDVPFLQINCLAQLQSQWADISRIEREVLFISECYCRDFFSSCLSCSCVSWLPVRCGCFSPDASIKKVTAEVKGDTSAVLPGSLTAVHVPRGLPTTQQWQDMAGGDGAPMWHPARTLSDPGSPRVSSTHCPPLSAERLTGNLLLSLKMKRKTADVHPLF